MKDPIKTKPYYHLVSWYNDTVHTFRNLTEYGIIMCESVLRKKKLWKLYEKSYIDVLIPSYRNDFPDINNLVNLIRGVDDIDTRYDDGHRVHGNICKRNFSIDSEMLVVEFPGWRPDVCYTLRLHNRTILNTELEKVMEPFVNRYNIDKTINIVDKEVWDFVKDTQYAYMFAYLLHSDPTDPHFKDIQVTEITRKTMLMGGNSAEDKIQVLDATKSLPGEKYGIEIKE